ncbi:hypothetical protein FSP39_020532 [Pinctada imbricata]|uniref:Uncharacterized protein n=1 Tax=Pinctada imbricata TaxID=66713 RepID=A0AA88Y1H9_PINIB|nr:hypothetical protein FSP39_020532 [Pinctada imbricata]
MNWLLLTAIVCTFGFFKDLRPSEAYLTSYLTGVWKNLTVEEVDNEVYPWWTYSYLLWLIPVFLLTDFLRYKPMLVIDGIAYIATWALLLWAQGIPLMKLMQVVYGLATAAEIGYYSYLFAKVSPDRYKQIASFTKAASLGGKFAAYLAGQLLISFEVLNFFHLNIFSFVSVCIAFLITIILPKAEHSEIFHRKKEKESGNDVTNDSNDITDDRSGSKIKNGFIFLWKELKSIYSRKETVLWSIWWALASCGNFQVGNYIQNMWKVISPNRKSAKIYNGAVEAAAGLFGKFHVYLHVFLK